MLLTTFWVDYPVLRETLSHAPDIEITWKRSDLTEDGDHRMLFWVNGDEIDAFDAGLETDPTITASSRVTDVEGRRLYHVELTPEGHQASVYPNVIEEGGIPQEVTATHEGWYFRIAFPSNEAVERFHSFFVENDLNVELRRLYDKSGTGGSGSNTQYRVTDRQLEALVTAVDAGYLDIPRACSLAELGERLGISQNAASERFRRGVRTLIENTVYPDDRSL
ncbi:helix-turn-helix domain-containing protein [Natrinema salinisoli]|uniref:helix-turn-helix domain-containing protein n=1 Tax=Natrinema salinisoli TaxID=2878535 RepID=UPI001CEFD6F3|nr:helix-turn-helix domain-containing protein [Natrinema salinisoli]